MPKLTVTNWKHSPATVNRFTGRSNGPCSEVALGDQVNLTQFGVHLEMLPPVLAGELVLVEDEESILLAGDAAAWKAGVPVGHCLENRSESPATFLVVGTRARSGAVHYPDYEIVMHHDEQGRRFTRVDGSPLE
jgi:uncharacterized cupin superfamily protein